MNGPLIIKYKDEEIIFSEHQETWRWSEGNFSSASLGAVKARIDREQRKPARHVPAFHQDYSANFQTVTVTSRPSESSFWITTGEGKKKTRSKGFSHNLFAYTPENERLVGAIILQQAQIRLLMDEVRKLKEQLTPLTAVWEEDEPEKEEAS